MNDIFDARSQMAHHDVAVSIDLDRTFVKDAAVVRIGGDRICHGLLMADGSHELRV